MEEAPVTKTDLLEVYRELHAVLDHSRSFMLDVIHVCKSARRIDEVGGLHLANAARKRVCDELWALEKKLSDLRSNIEKLP